MDWAEYRALQTTPDLFPVRKTHWMLWEVPILSHFPSPVPPQSMVHQELYDDIHKCSRLMSLAD